MHGVILHADGRWQMLKLTIAILAIALAGSASAAGWRSLTIDGSSEANFETSLAEFEARLSPARYQVFLLALKDVWEQGAKNAEAEQSEYTANDYLRQLDGLAYKQVVTLTDSTGDTAKVRLRDAIARVYAPRAGGVRLGSLPRPWTAASFGERNYPSQDPAGNPGAIPVHPPQ
jgi:hypothetical protein